MNLEYNGYVLEVKINEDYLVGRILQFPGEFSIAALTVSELREKFKRRVDLEVQKVEYEGHELIIKKSKIGFPYQGSSNIGNGWSLEGTSPELIIKVFKDKVNGFIVEEQRKKKRKAEAFVDCCVPIIKEIASNHSDKMDDFYQLISGFNESLS